MKHNRNSIGLRTGAAALSVLLMTTTLAPMAGAVAPVLDEAYYGTLNYFGGLTEGSVVKSYRTNGNQVISDTGVYDKVVNLTDRTEPTVSGDKVTFDLGDDIPDNFYFEGKTKKPYETMPFRIELSYRMNGVDTEPEEMAGQTGVGQVNLHVTPNAAASEYAKNNFVLMAMTVLRDSDILSVEAPGAQIQKVGDMVVVLYMVLPGEEQTFRLDIGAEDFAFNGFTFLVEPATLAQLDQIADLREAKEEVEDSYDSITDSVNTILNSLEGLDKKLVGTAGGLDQLNQGRATLSTGKGQVYDEADQALASMTNMSQSLAPVVGHLQTAKEAMAETTEKLTVLSDTVDTLRPDVKDLQKHLNAVQEDLKVLDELFSKAKIDMRALSSALDDLDSDLDGLQGELSSVQSQTKTVSNALRKLKGINQLGGITINQGGKEYTIDEVKAAHEKAIGIQKICEAMAGDPAGSLTAPTDAASYVAFVTENVDTIAGIAAENAVKAQGIDPDVDAEKYAAAVAQAKNEYSQMLSDAETLQTMAYLLYNWDDVEDQLKEAETFNDMIGQANQSIDQVNDAIDTVAKPTATLLDYLASLTDAVSDDLLDHSRDVLSAMQSILDNVSSYDSEKLHNNIDALLQVSSSLLGKTDTILEQSKDLSDTITKYEPDAQTALDDASAQVDAAVALLDDLNTFTKTFENLLKAADPNLDQGMEKSLTGLSASLRQMASGLGATDSIRTANNAVQKLVEDKWDEYTGEKNNVLNMDSNASMVSLTSDQNQNPNSIQLILRTQEIKVDQAKEEAAKEAAQKKTTFWDRVVRMFKDFGAIFTGD